MNDPYGFLGGGTGELFLAAKNGSPVLFPFYPVSVDAAMRYWAR